MKMRFETPIEKFEAPALPVVTDGEQRKYHNFLPRLLRAWACPRRLRPGFIIPFRDGSYAPAWRGSQVAPFRYRPVRRTVTWMLPCAKNASRAGQAAVDIAFGP